MTEQKNSKETEEKLQQLQLIEQSINASAAQKQAFQAQQMELESALEELKNKKTAYRIIGNVMVETDVEKLRKELERKKELTELRIKALEKQEEKISEKAKNLQEEVLKGMKKE